VVGVNSVACEEAQGVPEMGADVPVVDVVMLKHKGRVYGGVGARLGGSIVYGGTPPVNEMATWFEPLEK
jgi:hypothetical protein